MQGKPYMLLRIGGNRRGSQIAWAKLDEADYVAVRDVAWSVIAKSHGAGLPVRRYAVRRVDGQMIYLHRLLLGLERGDPRESDHINGDSLDNRRDNLRIVSTQGNAQNRHGPQQRMNKHGKRERTSQYRGVTRHAKVGWVAQGTIKGKRVYVGWYRTEDEANAAAIAWRREHMPLSEMDQGA